MVKEPQPFTPLSATKRRRPLPCAVPFKISMPLPVLNGFRSSQMSMHQCQCTANELNITLNMAQRRILAQMTAQNGSGRHP